jgi:hypothetical protein
MTSDGISTRDWNKVTDLALRIANESRNNHGKLVRALTRQLLDLLENLQCTYGERASIVATKADYTPHKRVRMQLLKRAHDIALGQGDDANLVLIAASLAEMYIDDQWSARNARQWLRNMKSYLLRRRTDAEEREYRRLRQRYARRRRRGQPRGTVLKG